MKTKSKKRFLIRFLKLIPLSLLTGAAAGGLGALFSKLISFATYIREQNGWILFLLLLGGVLSVGLYKILKVEGIGTNRIFEGYKQDSNIPIPLIPAIFFGTIITHLFGGSAGKEGAALQLGGGISSLLSKVFKLDNIMRRVLILCGMASFFSAVFGTPFGACIFALEVVAAGSGALLAFFPTLISSLLAYFISTPLGTHPESFSFTYNFNIAEIWKVIIIAAVSAFVAFIFCKALHFGEKAAERSFKNPFIRILIGAMLIIILTIAVKNQTYNGGGMAFITRIFETGKVNPEAFILKLVFTVITVSFGFKGGEIVPSFFIGAALGGMLAGVLNLSVPLGAAIGMAALFCAVTKCPLAAIVLSFELFGGSHASIYIALAIIISFFLSGKTTLYKE